MPDQDNYPKVIAEIVALLVSGDRTGADRRVADIAYARRTISRRPTIPRPLAIRIYRRDHWTCRYCGRPDRRVSAATRHAARSSSQRQPTLTTKPDHNRIRRDPIAADAPVTVAHVSDHIRQREPILQAGARGSSPSAPLGPTIRAGHPVAAKDHCQIACCSQRYAPTLTVIFYGKIRHLGLRLSDEPG